MSSLCSLLLLCRTGPEANDGDQVHWSRDWDLLNKTRLSAYALSQLLRTFTWCFLYLYVSTLIARADPTEQWRVDGIPDW